MKHRWSLPFGRIEGSADLRPTKEAPGSPCWLSWHFHQRTATVTEEWGIDWVMLDTHRHGLARYVELLTRSVAALWRLRSSTVIVQSPSILLAALAVAIRPVLGLCVVVDAHNEAIDPYTHDSPVIRWLIAFTLRSADATIVTNEELADRVAEMGGRAFVLPDAIPAPPAGSATVRTGALPVVLVVCTYAADEPVEVFVETARRLVRHAEVRLTGRPGLRARDLLRDSPENLKPLGFLPEADYWAELRGADVIVDLSLKPNCLVCGAYEAIAVGKAPVLSNDVSARRLFGEVATFVDNTADSLTDAIVARLAGTRISDDAVRAFRERYVLAWRAKLACLKAALECGDAHSTADLFRRRE